MLKWYVIIVYFVRKNNFLVTQCQGPCDFFPLSVSSSFRHRSTFTTTGFVHGARAERSWPRYPTETLCVGAVLGHIFTLLASFHTIATQCYPHRYRNVRAPSPHVWVNWGRVCVKRCVNKRRWEMECSLPNKTAAKRRMKSVRQTGTRQLMLFLQRYTVFKLLNYLVNELPWGLCTLKCKNAAFWWTRTFSHVASLFPSLDNTM